MIHNDEPLTSRNIYVTHAAARLWQGIVRYDKYVVRALSNNFHWIKKSGVEVSIWKISLNSSLIRN